MLWNETFMDYKPTTAESIAVVMSQYGFKRKAFFRLGNEGARALFTAWCKDKNDTEALKAVLKPYKVELEEITW